LLVALLLVLVLPPCVADAVYHGSRCLHAVQSPRLSSASAMFGTSLDSCGSWSRHAAPVSDRTGAVAPLACFLGYSAHMHRGVPARSRLRLRSQRPREPSNAKHDLVTLCSNVWGLFAEFGSMKVLEPACCARQWPDRFACSWMTRPPMVVARQSERACSSLPWRALG